MLNVNTPELKQRVAQKFSLAAAKYDHKANVQAEIAQDTLLLLGKEKVDVLLDVGCGTGKITRQLTENANCVLGVDLSLGMLSYARSQSESEQLSWITGDFDQLPIQDNCIDGVFSSMALQWTSSAEQCFSELYRVSKKGTRLVLAIMTEGSLLELRSSWSYLDGEQHVNQFCSAQALEQAAEIVGFSGNISEKQYQTWHSTVNDVMHSIKDVGAGVVRTNLKADSKAKSPTIGLSKSKLRTLQSNYSRLFQHNGKLPLTYRVSFLELLK